MKVYILRHAFMRIHILMEHLTCSDEAVSSDRTGLFSFIRSRHDYYKYNANWGALSVTKKYYANLKR